ncbi:hypothetical protein BBBOND_0207450 [Babesia bigemina]|uniref:Uncharacterized protein n=1 Tax=Babesia bigemina TaxID=5866 RepID=A0A061DCI4_BABBI|nr:hypothetical protein BBBOND_0207450 [Babesia bigemina]CDR95590.1 hypothetical protein BBBOND_0207450 [Babesia bigemina]|eukprot:XP_012767776.1 hypothetical protein BBBOND_0207450 [Babesia bigemina]
MAYHSLSEAPRNVKECIDWLMALKGTDAESNIAALGAALHDFLADKPVGLTVLPALENVKLISREFLEKPELKDQWCVVRVLDKFKEPMDKNPNVFYKFFGTVGESDYQNVVQTHGVDAEAMTAKITQVVDNCEMFLNYVRDGEYYTPSYSSAATWETSCSQDPEACAVVFVGFAPMLYTGLLSLLESSIVACFKWPPFSADKPMGEVLKAVGFEEPGCRSGIKASNVLRAFKYLDEEVFASLYDLAGFWAFY